MQLRFIRAFLIVTLVVFGALSLRDAGLVTTFAQSDALRSKYSAKKTEINSQIDSIKAELNALNDDFHAVSEQKRSLKEEVASIQEEIDNVNGLITETKQTISQLDGQIEKNEEDMAQVRDQLKAIIQSIQKQSKSSRLEVLLTSGNLGEAMSNVYNLGNIQSRAKQLNDRMEKLSQELDNNRQIQEETKETLENSQFLLASKQDGLKILLEKTEGEEAKYQNLISQQRRQEAAAAQALDNVEAEYQVEIERERREAEELRRRQEEEARRRAEQGINGGYTEKGNGDSCNYTEVGNFGVGPDYFIDPTNGWVSQDYWCGSYGGHDGWDIANGLGTPIVSVADGFVERIGYHPNGFGNFILLRHNLPSGKTVFTMYAHLQYPSQARGAIARGEQIGLMGSTGWSTGPHLHFMFISSSYDQTGNLGCRYGNSTCYDPADYF